MSALVYVRAGNRSEQFDVLKSPVREYDFAYSPVVYFETQNSYPVLLAFAFFGLLTLYAVGSDRDTAFYGSDQIIVAAYICIDFCAGHADIITNMCVGAGKTRKPVFICKYLCSAV